MCASAACGGRTLEFDGFTWQGSPVDEAPGLLADGGDSAAVPDGGGTEPDGAATRDAGIECRPPRWILKDLVRNARDLAGVHLRDGSSVPCGTWYRGSALANLSTDGCAAVQQLGIRTVIDLRTSAEREATPQSSCVDGMVQTVWAAMPTPYSVSAADYVNDLTTARSIVTAFDVLGDEAAYPVYFHCVYGRDRTGVLAAVILLALGASEDDVMAEYRLTAETQTAIYPNSLLAALGEIERRGGVDAYLASMGVAPERVAVLRAKAGIEQP